MGARRTGTEWIPWLDIVGRVPVPGDTVYGIGSGCRVAYQVTDTNNPKGFFVCGAVTLPDGYRRVFFDVADMYIYRNWFFDSEDAMAELRGRM